MLSYSIQEINEKLKGVIVGNTTQTIIGPEQLELANNSKFHSSETKNTLSCGKIPKPVPLSLMRILIWNRVQIEHL